MSTISKAEVQGEEQGKETKRSKSPNKNAALLQPPNQLQPSNSQTAVISQSQTKHGGERLLRLSSAKSRKRLTSAKSNKSNIGFGGHGRRESVHPGRRLSRFPKPTKGRDSRLDEFDDEEEQYRQLQQIFEAAENEGLSGLDKGAFKEALKKTVGRQMTEKDIEILFMKVDANCDQFVDWEEYVTFNLLEYKEKTLMFEMTRDRPFPSDIRTIESKHRDAIVRIAFWPNVRKLGARECAVEFNRGKYVTLSKDGVIGLWTTSMKNIKYYHANQTRDRNTQPWYTDMAVMYNVNMVAISSTDRDITIFDMHAKKFYMRYYMTGIESCITTMDYWVNPSDLNIAMMMWGDTSGNVYAIKFETSTRGGPFGTVSGKKNICKKISFPEVLRGFELGVRAYKFGSIHEDWVERVKYIPELDSFFSVALSTNTSMYFSDFTGKRPSVYYKVYRGILCFDYSAKLNIIATGGMDYTLRIWNPYVNNKAIIVLKGHGKPINHVIIHDTCHQVISIDKGRSLRVYDLRDQMCLQHISNRIIKLGPFPCTAAYYNPALKSLILATNQLAMLEKKEEEERFSEVISHQKPVVAALYSSTFNSVVSACQNSVVSIWDINTGDKIMQFVNAHKVVDRGVEIPVEITAVTFDANGRRLITGARDGTVHVWNFNNGSCMQQFCLPDHSYVSGIVSTRHRIYVTGWGKTVHVYIDGGGEEDRKTWRAHHKEDINSIAYLSPNIIATGSYDGDVIVWGRETGQVYCRLNAATSVKPVAENVRATEPVLSLADLDGILSGHIFSEAEEEFLAEEIKRKQFRMSDLVDIGLMSKFRGSIWEQSDTKVVNTCEHPLLPALDKERDSVHETRQYSREEYDHVCCSYESAVEKLLFLDKRDGMDKETAVLVTGGAEGWIRFWSIHYSGGLLGQFNVTHTLGENVVSMATNEENTFLFTGDTQGYVKVWDLKDYCIREKLTLSEKKVRIQSMMKKFTFFRIETLLDESSKLSRKLKDMYNIRPPPIASEPDKTLKYPCLLNSFRAHSKSVYSISFVEKRELLITASADCSIRLWTINGRYIGTFGQKWSHLPDRVTDQYMARQAIPRDIRRAASARTLKVLNGGTTPLWANAFRILRNRGYERLKKQFEHLQDKTEGEEVSEKELETSNILGKSYKRKVRHKLPPKMPKFFESKGSLAVYHALPFVDLTPVEVDTSKPPESILEIRERRLGSFAFKRMKGQDKPKSNVPVIMGLFDKVVNKPPVLPKKVRYKSKIKKVATKFQDNFDQTAASVKTSDKATPTLEGSGEKARGGTDPPSHVQIVLEPSKDSVNDLDHTEVGLAQTVSSNLYCTQIDSKGSVKLPAINA